MDDIYNPNHPNPPLSVLRREAEREERQADLAKAMKPVSEVMAKLFALKNEMARICVQNHTDIRTVECFYQWATEWQHEQQRAWE